MPLVEFDRVFKCFPHGAGRALLRTQILKWANPARHDVFFALKDVSFTLERGESVGFVGRNGAGKSTLLSVVAGLAKPNAGRVRVTGKIAALLELGSGFHPDLTGAENLVLNASLLGLSRKRTLDLFGHIVEFSGLSEFIDEPLRTYSAGMVMRLAFSVAVNTQPDLLLIDEILAVGDAAFQAKCQDALAGFRANGGSILLVSHAAGAVQRMCERAIWLDHGEVMMDGEVNAVVAAYEGRIISERPV